MSLEQARERQSWAAGSSRPHGAKGLLDQQRMAQAPRKSESVAWNYLVITAVTVQANALDSLSLLWWRTRSFGQEVTCRQHCHRNNCAVSLRTAPRRACWSSHRKWPRSALHFPMWPVPQRSEAEAAAPPDSRESAARLLLKADAGLRRRKGTDGLH